MAAAYVRCSEFMLRNDGQLRWGGGGRCYCCSSGSLSRSNQGATTIRRKPFSSFDVA